MKQLLLSILFTFPAFLWAQNLSVTEMGRYTDGREGACEISTYDAASRRLFTTNAASDSVDIIDATDVSHPQLIGGIDITTYGGGVNSVVALGNGYIAAAIEAAVKQDAGKVVFFDTAGVYVTDVTVGALPDMLTVSPDGQKVLVANEGEPEDDYLVDPAGSIAIIDISGGVASLNQGDVTLLDFTSAPANIPGGLKKPGTSYAVDLEPEYIAIDDNSTLAVVNCQESNILIFIDLAADSILSYKGLGFKDHSQAGNGFDASNRDKGINIQNWEVKGVYQPDAIASFTTNGNIYVVSANEGDARDYAGYSSETRIKDLTLDATAFPNAAILQEDSMLGRLKTFTEDMIGDTDNDGDVDELYSYGARSFSIWDASGNLVWDSGDAFETYIEANHAAFFNCNDGLASEMDNRSDDKGPEPEAVAVGQIGSKVYAFIGLERQGGIMAYDITDPNAPFFETFIHSFVGDSVMTDIAPEGLVFVPKAESHTNSNLLIVSSEVSGTTTIYELTSNVVIGIGDEVTGQNVKISPNPAQDLIRVEFCSLLKTQAWYSLHNAMGAEVKSGKLNPTTTELNLSGLGAGVYYLRVSQQGNAQPFTTRKIVKQ